MQGRSAILDVHAVDSTKKEFDVEIQRSDAGAYQSKSNIVTALEHIGTEIYMLYFLAIKGEIMNDKHCMLPSSLLYRY